MTPAAVLAIVVAAGEAHSAASTAMQAAAIEVVGEPEGVRVVEAAAVSDAEAVRVERALGVRAVVALAWGDADRLQARLRLHAARTDRWIDRDFVFAAADTPAERGRALGFAMATMLPEGDPSLPLAINKEAPREEAPAAPPGRNALEALFLAGGGLGGPAGGLGGRLAFERFVAARLSLDGAVASRVGLVSTIDARLVTSSLALGGALWALAPTAARRLGLAVRLEALLVDEAVAHTAPSGATTWKSQLLPGAALGAAATFRLGGPVELCVAGGLEAAFGTVDVTVVAPSGSGSARLPAARAVGEAGLRVRF
jgi:hypothetical protein